VSGMGPIVIEVELEAPVERVWRAWTEPDELASWLTELANVRMEVGGPYELFWEPEHPERNSTLGCTITALEPNRLLAFTWKGPVPYADLMNIEPPPTSVTVSFQASGPECTIVRLEHVGWGSGPRWEEARAWHVKAWQEAFARLKRHVER